MASNTVYDAVKTYLTAQWSSTTIAWENEPFSKPEPPAHWIAVEMQGTLYGQQSIGAGEQADNRWDEEGILWVHIMAPTGEGSSTARQYAKAIADLFRGTMLLSDSLEFMDASIGAGERGDDDGNYWRLTCTIDWRRMEA